MFIIHRTNSWGGYVAPEGGNRSYVVTRQQARQFATREEAEKNRCQINEVVEELTPCQ